MTVRTRSVAVAPSGQLAGQLEADDLRDEHRERLAELRGLGLDPADTPAQHAEPVHHRRVRVGADERVGEGPAVPLLDHAGEELEVHLVDDPRPGRHDLEVAEALLAPAEEGVALAVALELELDVADERAARAEDVDLHRVVDHELDRNQRVDLLRVAAEVGHRVAHRGEVDDGRDAGEVLEQDAGRRERDLAVRLVASRPSRPRLRRPTGRRSGARSRAGSGACRGGARRPTAPGARRAGGSRACDRRPRAWSERRTRRWPCLDSIKEAARRFGPSGPGAVRGGSGTERRSCSGRCCRPGRRPRGRPRCAASPGSASRAASSP